MLLVDSSAWIDFLNGQSGKQVQHLKALLGIHTIVMGDLILSEVLQGIKSDREFRQVKQRLLDFSVYPLCSEIIAIKVADNFRVLRKQGVTVRKTIDTIIATWCIENNVTLLHKDRNFQPFIDYIGLKSVF